MDIGKIVGWCVAGAGIIWLIIRVSEHIDVTRMAKMQKAQADIAAEWWLSLIDLSAMGIERDVARETLRAAIHARIVRNMGVTWSIMARYVWADQKWGPFEVKLTDLLPGLVITRSVETPEHDALGLLYSDVSGYPCMEIHRETITVCRDMREDDGHRWETIYPAKG